MIEIVLDEFIGQAESFPWLGYERQLEVWRIDLDISVFANRKVPREVRAELYDIL